MSDKGTHSYSNRHRMHEVSDTPRTDEAENAHYVEGDYFGEDTTKEAYQFARQLEREIRQLEVTIYDLKTENNLLHEALDQVIEDRDALFADLQAENDELRADNESLVQSNRQLRQSIAVLLDEPVNSL